jgi:RNA polymerase-binding transcription factor DksA
MSGFSKNKPINTQAENEQKEMQETKERFFVFIGKLEEKLKEFAAASIPELIEMNHTDTDEFKRGYLRLKSAVLGQLDSIREKASAVKEEKITYFPYASDTLEMSSAYIQFRNECYDRYSLLEDMCQEYRQRIEDTQVEDYELKYRKIVDEYEAIKDKFRCVQCGSPITIDKIYFTTTYITCPSCQTKNTFEPSSQAKLLEHIGRSLAEQRTKHILQQSDAAGKEERDLYHKAHQLRLSLIHEKNKEILHQKEKEMEELEQQRQEAASRQPILYQKYLRAMFDEWNKINPDLTNEHERFFTTLATHNNR